MGLASLLLLVGIYSAAISVSEDTKLRQTIRKLAIKESKLLDSIGSAEMEQEIIKKVDTIAKKQSDIMKEQTGIIPSMNENDVKDYLEQVINEIKNTKEK
jgi:thioredoxin-like negative regulator of GroEL